MQKYHMQVTAAYHITSNSLASITQLW